ncbi:hypothetical protein FYZ35_10705 [Mobiluncus mulieris]|uniref:hypothetical protein n=1 Tax=Mobiluncus mulieris TaxID=2052 RepID=UPI001470461C|nr:hypothetical protein [Mobiluncus mulieris]MCU9976531.1 hypothetical protein [Mobiluncus mulieris]NMW63690.1 hypothetical protein [Mobiluncus mulieris]
MTQSQQLELIKVLPADGSPVSFEEDATIKTRATNGECTSGTQQIHLRSSMGKKYIGNKPKTECTSTAKYMQIDTVLFRRHWLFGWGSPTEHTGRAYNTHKFKHRGVARKCNGYKKHDWRAVNTHFIIDKYGCKIMLYSSTEKEGVSCS